MIILCIDGLEYELVLKWGLRNLLQETYGTYPVDTRYNSIQLWSSFLTGYPPYMFERYFVVRPFNLHKRRIPNFLKAIGRKFIPLKSPSVRGRYETFLDVVKPSKAINMFAYNEDRYQLRLRYRYSLLKSNIIRYTISKRKTLAWIWIKWTRSLIDKLFKALDENQYKLVLIHFYHTDYIGHILYGSSLHRKSYEIMDNLIPRLEKYNQLILVVSDHGMKDGVHTDHGFYSLNTSTRWKPLSISDFHNFIIEVNEKYPRVSYYV